MSKLEYLRKWWNAKYYLRREKIYEAHQHREAVALGFGALSILLLFLTGILIEAEIRTPWVLLLGLSCIISLFLFIVIVTISSHKLSDTRYRTETYVWNELLEPGPTRLDEEE